MATFKVAVSFVHVKTVVVNVKARSLEVALESAEKRKQTLYGGGTMRGNVTEKSSMTVAPAEQPTTFEVGDRVKVATGQPPNWPQPGWEGVIDEILPNGDINVTFSDGFDGTAIWDFSPHELQKIQACTAEP